MDQYLEFISNHYLLCLALVVITYLLLQDLADNAFKKFESLSPMLTVNKMNSSDTIIVDVRAKADFLKGHIEDAINIPMEKFEEKSSSLNQYKAQPIIVVCQTGNVSTSACKTLLKAEFEQVFNMSGGMQSWEDGNLPIKISSKNKK